MEAVESGRGNWGTAIGLTVAVVVLSVFDGLPLVVLPLALFLVALPGERKGLWVVVGLVLWLAVLRLSGGPLAAFSRGWALVLGAIFLAMTLLRPDWDVTSRSIGAVAVGLAVSLLALFGSGEAAALDTTMQEHFAMLSQTFVDLQARLPETAQLADFEGVSERMVEIRSAIYPALLALQSVAALALVSWWVRRLGRSDSPTFVLSRMRDFRFNDQLIWALIAGIVLVLLPLGDEVARAGINLLVFMGGLYVLRGLAVFVFLATGSRSVPTMVFGALAVILFYPVVFTAALLMGVGDTWLDVRQKLSAETST